MRKLKTVQRSTDDAEEDGATAAYSMSSAFDKREQNIPSTTTVLSTSKIPLLLVEQQTTSSSGASTVGGDSTIFSSYGTSLIGGGVLVKKPGKNGKTTTHRLTISPNNRVILLSGSLTRPEIEGLQGKKSNWLAKSGASFSSSGISKIYKSIDVALIDRLQRGQSAFKYPHSTTNKKLDNSTSLSIIYDGGMKSLDLMVFDVGEFEALFKALTTVFETYQAACTNVHPDILVAEHLFHIMEKKMSDRVSQADICQMLDRLSVSLSKKEVSVIFKKFCDKEYASRSGGLNLCQFAKFLSYVKDKTRCNRVDPISRVMKKILDISNSTSVGSQKNTTGQSSVASTENERIGIFGSNEDSDDYERIDAELFHKFLRLKQKEKKISLSEVKEMCQTYNKLAGEKDTSSNYLTKAALQVYLMSECNDVFDPLQSLEGRCDMKQPLSSYWINTSFKTYNGSIEAGDSKNFLKKADSRAQSYLHALYRGCRCIEVDVWDGGDSFQREPVVAETCEQVRNGSKTVKLFVDVLSIIHGFVKSHPQTYPIILGIENHCSIQYQNTMASHISHILDGIVYMPKSFIGVLPSPEALRGKVVIRSKRPDAIKDNPTAMLDDFDMDNDFSSEEAAVTQNFITSEPEFTSNEHGLVSGSADMMSFISEAPIENELDVGDILNNAELDTERARRNKQLAEAYAFDLDVKATQAEGNVQKLLGRLGLDERQLDVIEKQRNKNEQKPVNNNTLSGKMEKMEKMLREAKEDYDNTVDQETLYYESLDNGVQVSQSIDAGEHGVEVEDYFANEVGYAKKRYAAIEAEASVAANAASIAMVEMQEAILEVSEAFEALRKVKTSISDNSQTAKSAASTARSHREYATIAKQRQETVKDLLRTRKEALANAESVAATAAAESSISEERAKDAEMRSQKALEVAESERHYAETETRKEEDFEAYAMTLQQRYVELVGGVKLSNSKVESILSSLKVIENKIYEIERSPKFIAEKKERQRQKAGQSDNSDSISSFQLLSSYKKLQQERKSLSAILKDASSMVDPKIREALVAEYDGTNRRSRKQAEIASIARRQADKSIAIAERLAEQAEEERDAANLRMIATEKAEVFVKRAEAEYESTIEQLNEANKASKESQELALESLKQAESKAKMASRDVSYEEKVLRAKEEKERRARERYEAAEKVKARLDSRLNDAKKALERSEEIYSLAKDEIAAETYRTNAAKHAEANAIIVRKQAMILREKADEAEKKSREANKIYAEASASFANAQDYKKKKEKVKPLAIDFVKLVLISSTKFKYWEKSLALPFLQMHSICEGLMVYLSERGPSEWCKWIEYNKKHLTRTFPSMKYRQVSSNYNPMIPWAMGCQMVGMNVQSSSGMTLLVDGRFRENGSTGYVLKPLRLIDRKVSMDKIEKEPMKTLRLRVISGHNIPKPEGARKKSPIISPRVKVIVYDGVPGKGSIQHATRAVRHNGLNPIWDDEGATFSISSPSVAMVLFSVWDADGDSEKDYFIAASAIPFSCLRQGFRSIKLFDANCFRSGLYGTASLFVELSVQ